MINSKVKGKVGELEFSNLCKEHGYNTRRTAQYNGKELDSKADIIGLNGFHIEIKRVQNLNLDNAIEQAVRDNKSKDIPIVVHRKNNKKWKITMYAEDWFKLYEKFKENE